MMTALTFKANKDVRNLHTNEMGDLGVPVQGSRHIASNELVLSRSLRDTRDQRIGQRTNKGHNPHEIRM